MPRAEVGTPKYLSNKMKSKGLQKLRWYCQMCQKQCRDDNGFKCHIMSESHQRQILLFADNSKRYIDDFSREFDRTFMDILRRQFGSKRVFANRVYQEYISDRNHLHMNSTRWVTLTGYVKWLGRVGKCIVDETEKGWYITYIDRDPETILRQEKRSKRLKNERDNEERTQQFIENQIKHAQAKLAEKKTNGTESEEVKPVEFTRSNDDEKVTLDINLQSNTFKTPAIPFSKLVKDSMAASSSSDTRSVKSSTSTKSDRKRKSALDEIMESEETRREKRNRKDYWLTEGIVVKVLSKKLGDDFYKQKGVVVSVQDKYVAVVKMLDEGKKAKIDQSELETVVPAVGRPVKIVNGAYRGEIATFVSLDVDNYCGNLEIATGLLRGRKVNHVSYEDFSKLHIEEEEEEEEDKSKQ